MQMQTVAPHKWFLCKTKVSEGLHNAFNHSLFFMFDRTGNPSIISGKATLISKNKSTLNYQAESRLPNLLSRMLPTTGMYHILYSDYKNYTVLWSCTSFGLFHTGNILYTQ